MPLATTEGGLVASVNRGCAAIRQGGYGGARTVLVDDGITRAPCIVMPDIHLALELKQVGFVVRESAVVRVPTERACAGGGWGGGAEETIFSSHFVLNGEKDLSKLVKF